MSLRWGEEKIKGLLKMVKTAERSDWFDGFFYWLILGACVWAIAWMMIKIYQLHQISVWLDTI